MVILSLFNFVIDYMVLMLRIEEAMWVTNGKFMFAML